MKTLITGMGNIGVSHGWLLSQNGVDIYEQKTVSGPYCAKSEF